MKQLIISTLMLFCIQGINAQTDETSMQQDFRAIAHMGARQNGFEGVQTYSNNEVKGSQFFDPKWSRGSVTTKDGTVISKNYLFLFDKVRQELFIKVNGANEVLLADKGEMSAFSINTDKTHEFKPARFYDKTTDESLFYEVLVKNDNGYSLLKTYNTKFVKANKNDMERVKNGDFSDEFKDDIKYYISYKNGAPEPIFLKERSIKKAFKDDKETAVKDFFKSNNADINEDYIVNLVNTVNG